MPILTGALAYRALPNDDLVKRLDAWRMLRRADGGEPFEIVACPKCGRTYALIAEASTTDESLKEDREFLSHILSTGHPQHPEYLIIRDLDCSLRSHLDATNGCAEAVADPLIEAGASQQRTR